MKIEITIPIKILGFRLGAKKYRRSIPEAWSFILDGKRRLLYIKILSLMPFDSAIMLIIKDILGLHPALFAAIDPADIAAIEEKLAWMRLEPSATPILSNFRYKGKMYCLPRPEFLQGSAWEFALADGYYQEWIGKLNETTSLLQLVATLCRVYDKIGDKLCGDGRRPLSSYAEHEIEVRAEHFVDLDLAIVVAVLRYFEGVKKMVHEYGTASGIFEQPDEDNENTQKSKALFGWWTAFRGVAKSQNKREEDVWAMSLWRVLSIMIEEKQKADDIEKRSKAQN